MNPLSVWGFALPSVESICGACGTPKDEPSPECWSRIVTHPDAPTALPV